MVTILREQKDYKDLDLNFLPHPVHGDITVLRGANAVRRSVKNLVLTNFYERPFQPGKGSGVAQLLFEPFGPKSEKEIKGEIERVLARMEPRIEDLRVVVESNVDLNGFEATIHFVVISLPFPITVTLFLERVR